MGKFLISIAKEILLPKAFKFCYDSITIKDFFISEVKTLVEKRLFWFLKDGTELDLSNKTHLDMFIQQTLSKGRASDVKSLFRMIGIRDFIRSFNRIKNFLPREVKNFWEEWLGNINQPTKEDTPSL